MDRTWQRHRPCDAKESVAQLERFRTLGRPYARTWLVGGWEVGTTSLRDLRGQNTTKDKKDKKDTKDTKEEGLRDEPLEAICEYLYVEVDQ